MLSATKLPVVLQRWPNMHAVMTRLLGSVVLVSAELDTPAQERVYDVGSHCGSRVHLYHSLWHYKRRLCGQLKKELKAARLFLEVRSSL